jgi:hypothetical protein
MALARQALQKLLERGERAALKEESRAVTLPFTQASFPRYFKLASHRDKEAMHAALREAQRAGAISIDWDRLAGEEGQITRITLIDAQVLAKHLGVTSHAEWMARARKLLQPWAHLPRVGEILTAWEQLRTARGRGVEDSLELVDALKVLDHCSQERDTSVRILSAALFNSSKRLEQLEPWLDMLTDRELKGPRRPGEEVFAALGLVKHPPAVHVAGKAQLVLSDGRGLEVPAPFIALAPRSIAQINLDTHIHTILSVENLTIFHEIAEGRAGDLSGYLLLYTAGMPAPSFLRFYRQLLSTCGPRRLIHWGDIDPSGFRIAACLARAAYELNQTVTLWQMRADTAPLDRAWRELSTTERTEIQRLCELHGWAEEGAAAARVGLGFEQEALPVRLPPRD